MRSSPSPLRGRGGTHRKLPQADCHHLTLMLCFFGVFHPTDLRQREPLGGTSNVEREKLHELAIAESVIEIVTEEAGKHSLERINKVRIQVGELAAVVPESLTFCLDLLCRDTIAEGAVFEIETVGIVARCDKCDLTFDVRDQVFRCPRCAEPTMELLSGRELSVTSIEGETGEGDGSD